MDFLSSANSVLTPDLRLAIVSILVAFAGTHVLAVAYVWTYRGMSFSQAFVQTLVMGGVATSMMMLAIGNNLVWGIGMVGALALVRFRSNLRDPRDMIFIFASLVIGIASGTRAFAIVGAGTILFCAVALYLSRVSFGLSSCFDALLRYTLSAGNPVSTCAAQGCVDAHCSKAVLVMMQQVTQGEATEHVYQVRFRRQRSRQELVRDLERVPGLTDLSLMLEEARVDV